MHIFSVTNRIDQVLHADKQWLEMFHTRYCCSVCHNPAYVTPRAIDVVVQEKPMAPCIGVWHCSCRIYRFDLWLIVGPALRPHALSDVMRTGRQVKGYLAVIFGDTVRVGSCGMDGVRRTQCPECGRVLQNPIGDEYYRQADVLGRKAFVGTGGAGLYISESMREKIPPDIAAELKITPIPVRDGPMPKIVAEDWPR